MRKTVTGSAIGLLLGVIIGMSTGVAGFGGAMNGAYIFGPIIAIIGGLIGSRLIRKGKSREDI